eukprot:TRINITY_DN55351_c0_g1_i1.p1 TRINITY_DN55351_c0_g1~~TRINITY_DN55351_c0_g1_i1.p1  ORF type:complete len:263 (+),score=35.73 TRINITY_DN55351_c0_g1_i1:212-1000(+)
MATLPRRDEQSELLTPVAVCQKEFFSGGGCRRDHRTILIGQSLRVCSNIRSSVNTDGSHGVIGMCKQRQPGSTLAGIIVAAAFAVVDAGDPSVVANSAANSASTLSRRGIAVKPDGTFVQHRDDGSFVDLPMSGFDDTRAAGEVVTIRHGDAVASDMLAGINGGRGDSNAERFDSMVWRVGVFGLVLGIAKFWTRVRQNCDEQAGLSEPWTDHAESDSDASPAARLDVAAEPTARATAAGRALASSGGEILKQAVGEKGNTS